jgi:ribonuclease HI
MTIYAYTDGASRGNPGESGIGVVMKDENGRLIHSAGKYIGKATNNIAEYMALIECLKKARDTNCRKLVVHSDSELLVRQLQGTYRVRNEGLRKYFQRVHRMLENAPFEFEIRHVSREQNKDADMLANVSIDSKSRVVREPQES